MTAARSPAASVGLPVYNGEKYLREAVDAALGQTFRDMELVICDNASTDRTEEICREYAASDRRVRYYRNATNLGAAKNFNRVFDLSRGKHFKWLAVDDLIAPENLERCLGALESNPRAVLSYTLARHIDALGQPFSTNGVLGPMTWRQGAANRFKQLIERFTKDDGVCAPMMLFGAYRREALLKARPMGGFFASDLVLLAELALQGEFEEVPDQLLSIRLHPGSSSWAATWSYDSIMNFYDPQVRGKALRTIQMQRYNFEYFTVIARSDLRLQEKADLFIYCTRPPLIKVRRKLKRRTRR